MGPISSTEKNARLKAIYLGRINPAVEAKLRLLRESTIPGVPLSLCFDRSTRVRREAAKKLLSWVDHPAAFESLKRLLKDQDRYVRWHAALALGEKSPEINFPEISNLLSKTGSVENWLLASVIQRQGVSFHINPLLVRGLEGAEIVRNLAVYLLGQLGESNLIARLAEDPSPAVRETVLSYISPTRALLTPVIPLPQSVPDRDRFTATLLAMAIGDAMGAPVEFSTLANIRSLGYVDGYLQDPARPLLPGDYTDDVQMAVMVIRSILRSHRLDPTDIAKVFGATGLAIDLGKERNLGYSFSTLDAYRKLYAGLNWRLASQPSNGCGPATAVVPIGLIFEDFDTLREAVKAVTFITKTGSEALAGALATAFIVHQNRWQKSPDSPVEIIERTAQFVEDVSQPMAQEIRRLALLLPLSTEDALNHIPHDADGKKVRTGMKALGVVPSAIYCFVKSLTDLRQTILSAVNTEGDSDSIAALAGAFSGAYNGLSAIPGEWIAGLVEHENISRIAGQLAAL